MKIAVTGGSGFIGQRLVKRLEKAGHQIVNIDSEDPDNPIDICYEQALEKSLEGCDAIYHLAAAHRDDISPKSIYYDVNGQGTKNIIQAAKAHNIQRIIFASTVAVYGLNAGEASEETKPEPFNDYGKSKLEAEQYLKAWQSESDDHILSIIRPVVVFGEGNRGNVYTLMKQIAGNKFIMIGKGQNKKSMAYVENVALFFEFCLNQKTPLEIYNYADKPDLTTQKLVTVINEKLGKSAQKISLPYPLGITAGYAFDTISKVTGKKLPISSIRVKKFCADTVVNADKAHQSEFQAEYDLTHGIKNMLNYEFPVDQKVAA